MTGNQLSGMSDQERKESVGQDIRLEVVRILAPMFAQDAGALVKAAAAVSAFVQGSPTQIQVTAEGQIVG